MYPSGLESESESEFESEPGNVNKPVILMQEILLAIAGWSL